MLQIFCYPNVYPLATLSAMKDVGLRIRVQRDLRDAFIAACQSQDRPAAQVLREFMREYVAKHPSDHVLSKSMVPKGVKPTAKGE